MLQNLIQTRVEYSNIPVGPFGLPSRCCIVCQSVRAPYAQLSCLYSPSPTDAAKCAPLPSSWFPSLLRYYGYIGLPVAHLGSYRVPLVWFPYPEGDNRASSVLYEIAIIDLAKFSDRGCHSSLTLTVPVILSAALSIASTISNLIIISRLNHFTLVSALSLPVLRLNLML